jgi:hypothetical protein
MKRDQERCNSGLKDMSNANKQYVFCRDKNCDISNCNSKEHVVMQTSTMALGVEPCRCDKGNIQGHCDVHGYGEHVMHSDTEETLVTENITENISGSYGHENNALENNKEDPDTESNIAPEQETTQRGTSAPPDGGWG